MKPQQVLCSYSLDHVGWYRDVFATVFKSGAWAFPQELRKNPNRVGFVAQPKLGIATPILPMQSCFGGLAIYDLKMFLDPSCDYVGTEVALTKEDLQAYAAHDNVLCEHIPFHFCLTEKLAANIGLVRDMGVFYERPGYS